MEDQDARASEQGEEPVVIPHGELSPEALRGVVEAFVLREGTEYGPQEFSLEQKVAHVMRQLNQHEARILFDPLSQSVNIVTVSSTRSQ